MTERPSSYSYDDLIKHGHGELMGPDTPRLPLPPMLMFDRVTSLAEDGGAHGKGQVIAEFDIKPDLWFFDCHFKDDPVMPGCLGLDALWQLTGFYLTWLGNTGKGRALGCGEVKFSGMVTPETSLVTYEVDFSRVRTGRLVMGIADGIVKADGEKIFEVKNMKVGIFNE